MVMQKIKEKTKEMSKKKIALISIAIGIIFGLVFGYILTGFIAMRTWELPFISFSTPKYGIEVSTQEISSKVEKFIDTNFLAAYNAKAKITNITTKGSVYALDIDILQNGVKISEGVVYVTSDGEFLFIGPIYNMSESLPQINQMQESATKEIPKTEKPDVKLFIMSYCPYGIQAINSMFPVIDLLGDKINFETHYVIYSAEYYRGQEDKYCLNKTYCSMHGVQELNENIRQMCIKEKYDYSTWKEYIKAVSSSCNYQNVDNCWEDVAKSKGIDTNLIKTCYNENALKYAEAEFKLNQKYGIEGSPTLLINEVEYYGSRNPEAYKNTICSAFLNQPSACSTRLSNDGGTVSGSCG